NAPTKIPRSLRQPSDLRISAPRITSAITVSILPIGLVLLASSWRNSVCRRNRRFVTACCVTSGSPSPISLPHDANAQPHSGDQARCPGQRDPVAWTMRRDPPSSRRGPYYAADHGAVRRLARRVAVFRRCLDRRTARVVEPCRYRAPSPPIDRRTFPACLRFADLEPIQ